jgi:hypothetical protein
MTHDLCRLCSIAVFMLIRNSLKSSSQPHLPRPLNADSPNYTGLRRDVAKFLTEQLPLMSDDEHNASSVCLTLKALLYLPASVHLSCECCLLADLIECDALAVRFTPVLPPSAAI